MGDPRLLIALIGLVVVVALLFVAAALRAGGNADDAVKRARDAGTYGDHPALPRKLVVTSHRSENAR